MLDIGSLVQDIFVVESISLDPPEVWLNCPNRHRVWCTPKMLDGGMKILCAQCASEAARRAQAAKEIQRNSEAINANHFEEDYI
jgi:hypothetical protein